MPVGLDTAELGGDFGGVLKAFRPAKDFTIGAYKDESRYGRDTKAVRQILFTIDIENPDRVILGLECINLRLQFSAWAAPGCREFEDRGLIGFEREGLCHRRGNSAVGLLDEARGWIFRACGRLSCQEP